MSVKVSATFTDAEYSMIAAVVAYQRRSMSSYIGHCVMIETKKRINDAERAGYNAADYSGYVSAKPS